jgi:DUF1680 family protein
VALKDVALNLGTNSNAPFHEEFQKDLLGGVLVLRHPGEALGETAEQRRLYFQYSGEPRKSKPVSLTFIPYYAWANRTATPMQVWTPLSRV